MSTSDELNYVAAHLPLTNDELQLIQIRGEAVHDSVLKWTRKHPVLAASMSIPISILMTVSYRNASVEALGLLTAMTLWTVAFDDLMDRNDQPIQSVSKTVDGFLDVSSKDQLEPVRHTHVLGSILADFRRSLAQYPTWIVMRADWDRMLERMLRGSVFEYSLSKSFASQHQSFEIPSLHAYLQHARHSIGLPWLLISSLVVSVRTNEIATRLTELISLAERCGEAMRLANDLASFERENCEETVANAVRLTAIRLAKESAITEQQAWDGAEVLVQRWLGEVLTGLEKTKRVLKGGSDIEWGFIRLTELGISFYQMVDFRNWQAYHEMS